MPWTKLDDGFSTNPKIARLSDTAFRLYVHGLVYSVQNLTDGRIDSDLLQVVFPGKTRQNLKKSVAELESGGLWIPEGGWWQIKDFSEYQPTKADVEKQRERWRKWKQNQRGVSDVHTGQTEDKRETPDRTPLESPRATVPSRSQIAAAKERGRKAKEQYRQFHMDRAMAEAKRQQNAGTEVRSLGGLAKRISERADFIEESEYIWLHRDCDDCGGKGYLSIWSPGGGGGKVKCQ